MLFRLIPIENSASSLTVCSRFSQALSPEIGIASFDLYFSVRSQFFLAVDSLTFSSCLELRKVVSTSPIPEGKRLQE